jgi:hypothetical protein
VRGLHRDAERDADLGPGEAVLVARPVHEIGAEATGFLLDTGHQKRSRERTVDAATARGRQPSERFTHDTPLLRSQ